MNEIWESQKKQGKNCSDLMIFLTIIYCAVFIILSSKHFSLKSLKFEGKKPISSRE